MRKTYIVDLSNLDGTWKNFEKRTRNTITKAQREGYRVEKSDDIHTFNKLHKVCRPDRIISDEFILNLYGLLENRQLYFCGNAAALISWDSSMGYYLLAARNKEEPCCGEPTLILWEAMKDLNSKGIKKLNLCGANKPNIIKFKRGFGGKLIEAEPCLKY